MTPPATLFPPPIPSARLRATLHLAQALSALSATTATIERASSSRAVRAAPDWHSLQASLVEALSGGGDLPLRVRVHLSGLLAWTSSNVGEQSATDIATQVAQYYASRGGASPSKLAELLQWAPEVPAVQRLWATAPRPSRKPRFATWHWLLELEWGRPVAPSLAQRVHSSTLADKTLPAPLVRGFTTPLSRLVWDAIAADTADSWQRRQEAELRWFLSSADRAIRYASALAETLLAPLADDLDALRRRLSASTEAEWRIGVIATALPLGGRGVGVHDLSPAVQSVLGVWRVVRELDAFFASWGGDPERKGFWRSYQERVLDARWYERSGWLALKIGPRWFLEHKSGRVRVWAIEEAKWPEVADKVANCPGSTLLAMDRALKPKRGQLERGLRDILLSPEGWATLRGLLAPA